MKDGEKERLKKKRVEEMEGCRMEEMRDRGLQERLVQETMAILGRACKLVELTKW